MCVNQTPLCITAYGLFMSLTRLGTSQKLHKEERPRFKIAQRQLANVPLICALHNTHRAAKTLKTADRLQRSAGK